MPATATARKSAARSAPRTAARALPAPRRVQRPAPRGAHSRLVPVAVGRTAVAVGGLADSALVLGLTRSRLWIGLLAGMLVGIVGLNVMALQLNATASKTAGISDELKRDSSALRAQIAGGLSNERLQRAAARLGLVVPEPGAIRYLDLKPGDAAAAAARLRDGGLTLGSTYVPAAPIVPVEPVATDTTAVDPESAPVEPVAEPTQPTGVAVEYAPSAPTESAPVASGGASVP